MLPGWGADPGVFDGLMRALSPRIASAAPHVSGNLLGHAPDLRAVAAALAADAPARCTVIGWSLGGQIALEWARARPQQVERLVLFATTPRFVQRDGWTCAMDPQVFGDFTDAVAADPAGTLSRFNALQAYGDVFPRAVLHRLRALSGARAAPSAQSLASGLRLLATSDLRASLHGISQPTLVLHGARDQVVPIGAAEALASALPHGELAVLIGAAHVPFLSQPQTVARIVSEFLS